MKFDYKLMGRRVKDLLEQKGFNFRQVADRCETSGDKISRIISGNGKVILDIELVYKLADCLDTTIDYLVGRSDENNYLSKRS